jgi:hypothetical protein
MIRSEFSESLSFTEAQNSAAADFVSLAQLSACSLTARIWITDTTLYFFAAALWSFSKTECLRISFAEGRLTGSGSSIDWKYTESESERVGLPVIRQINLSGTC